MLNQALPRIDDGNIASHVLAGAAMWSPDQLTSFADDAPKLNIAGNVRVAIGVFARAMALLRIAEIALNTSDITFYNGVCNVARNRVVEAMSQS